MTQADGWEDLFPLSLLIGLLDVTVPNQTSYDWVSILSTDVLRLYNITVAILKLNPNLFDQQLYTYVFKSFVEAFNHAIVLGM